MVSNPRFYRLFPLLIGLFLLLVSTAWAQLPVMPKCEVAGPACSAETPAVQQASSVTLEDILADLRSPSPIHNAIIGPCCTGGASKCPKVTGFNVVGCGANCGTGSLACLYLHK
ncbi:MAG TPA: hypothetical protein VF173_30345 [Thermoanaerobaculia bacterium]|nr:hypothetical protein [Thermoanaerobaculia bacterium]